MNNIYILLLLVITFIHITVKLFEFKNATEECRYKGFGIFYPRFFSIVTTKDGIDITFLFIFKIGMTSFTNMLTPSVPNKLPKPLFLFYIDISKGIIELYILTVCFSIKLK
jgi:hypothetical protein